MIARHRPVPRALDVRSFRLLSLSTTAVWLTCATARADVTSWLAVGGGVSSQRNRETSKHESFPLLTYSIGVGSPSERAVVLGGLLRGTTLMGIGTDLGLAARVASGGFARGDWGVALEAAVVVPPEAGWGGGVRALNDARVRLAVNPNPSRGMFSSIQIGLRAAPDGIPVAILPGDMPFVAGDAVRRVLSDAIL